MKCSANKKMFTAHLIALIIRKKAETTIPLQNIGKRGEDILCVRRRRCRAVAPGRWSRQGCSTRAWGLISRGSPASASGSRTGAAPSPHSARTPCRSSSCDHRTTRIEHPRKFRRIGERWGSELGSYVSWDMSRGWICRERRASLLQVMS
jgi:hypothetical protein